MQDHYGLQSAIDSGALPSSWSSENRGILVDEEQSYSGLFYLVLVVAVSATVGFFLLAAAAAGGG